MRNQHGTTMRHQHRRTKLAALGLLALLAFGACSASSKNAAQVKDLPAADGTEGGADESENDARPQASAIRASGGGASGAAPSGDLAAPLPQGLGNDRVVKTASLEIEVDTGSFASAFSKVSTIAAANGGFVASSDSRQSTDDEADRQSAGSLVVRVPSANFDATRTQLIELGDLRSQQVEGTDVGGQLTDLEARLRNLRSHEEAIRILMTKTGTIGETIEVQRQLSTVREQIEQLAGEQARLTDAVSFATLTLALAEPNAAFVPDGGASPLGDAFARAVDATQAVLAGVIVSAGYLVPLALLAGLVWFAVRPFVAANRRRLEPINPPASSA